MFTQLRNLEVKRRFDSFSVMIDFDHAVYTTLTLTLENRKFSPQNLFFNADINGDGTLEFNEVSLLLQFSSPEY